jgi:D-alanyl-D-alanine carboxypeptidase
MIEDEHTHTESQLKVLFQDAPITKDDSPISSVPVLPQMALALGLLFVLFGVTYVGTNKKIVTEQKPRADIIVTDQLPAQVAEVSNTDIFEETVISAQSAIVWDAKRHKVLFNKNADDRRPLASITKLMTALIAYELLDPSTPVEITNTALRADGDSGFHDGEMFTMQNLADLTLIESSNDGASALGAAVGTIIAPTSDTEQAFVHAMNVKAEELGLGSIHFENSTGLDISESEAGAYGSARDVALLMEYIIKYTPDAVTFTNLDAKVIYNKNGDSYAAENTNTIVDEIEGLMASKTGYTDLSGGNLVVAVNVGLDHPIIIAVLGSTQNGRFSDTDELLRRARLSVAQNAK